MSKSLLISEHNRDLIWHSIDGPLRVRHMSASHIEVCIRIVERRLRRSRCFELGHPQRKYEPQNERYLRTFQSELEWRKNNGN